MKRIAIAALAAALLAGCVGTLVHVPGKAFVMRGALLYRADMIISTNGVECSGKADAAAIKAAGEAGGKAAAAYLKSNGL